LGLDAVRAGGMPYWLDALSVARTVAHELTRAQSERRRQLCAIFFAAVYASDDQLTRVMRLVVRV
jgi:hypothetical protein